ncbi:hypothetical protein [Soonwooa sp.]|uniref:hypothetical protein n=1 Tax=Soonwooa sp. TaxID=1938592 RepID=UPI0026126D51|nr:hypothetical protein [Soonwooa sp.]
MKSKLLLLLFFCLSSSFVWAQKVFSNTGITDISFDGSNIDFYQKIDKNKYYSVDFKIEKTTDDRDFSQEIEVDKDKILSLKEITDNDEMLFNKDNIVSMPLSQLKEKLKKTSFSAIVDTDRQTYFLMHPSFFCEATYDLEREDLKAYKTKIYGDLKKASTENSGYCLIDLGDNKFVIILDRAEKLIYNSKNGLKMIGDKKKVYTTVNKNPINFDKLLEVTNPEKFWMQTRDIYFEKPEGKNQYALKNAFGENVLPAKFDTIYQYDYFLVGRTGTDYKIYNTYLKELPIKNVKSVYPYKNGLQVIQNNELKVYDIDGNILNEYFKTPSSSYCGTISFSEDISISKDNSLYDGAYYLHVVRDVGREINYKKDFIITNIPKDANLKFAANIDVWNRSDIAAPRSWVAESGLVLVQKNGLTGLYQIPDISIKIDDKASSNSNSNNVQPPSKIELIEKLPIKYKNIYSLKDRIYFESQNGIGIYDLMENKEFAELKSEGPNYYRIKDKSGKYGWLSYADSEIAWDN